MFVALLEPSILLIRDDTVDDTASFGIVEFRRQTGWGAGSSESGVDTIPYPVKFRRRVYGYAPLGWHPYLEEGVQVVHFGGMVP